MKLRKNFLPKNLADWSSFLFIVTVIPIFYWFVLFFVLPKVYSYSSFWYWLHFATGTFIMKNITSNLLAVMFIDTSIYSVTIPVEKCFNLQLCEACQLFTPPRCWHCNTCNRCILKRDHHCTFSGCCIGHFNQRFFIWFLSYFFLGCCYALYFNAFYIFTQVPFNLFTIIQVVIPALFIMTRMDLTVNHCLLFMFVLNVVGFAITGLLLNFHLKLIFKGIVSYEYVKSNTRYNSGLKHNIISTLGTRWYLTWISPFINSPLISDGVDWHTDGVPKTKKI